MSDALWSFVDLSTGEFTGGQAYGGLDIGFSQPAGILPVLGDYPPALWRYDTEKALVVERTTPAGPTAADLRLGAAEAMGVLRMVEAGSLRAIRECLLALHNGVPMPSEAISKLQGLEDMAIESLRPAARAAIDEFSG